MAVINQSVSKDPIVGNSLVPQLQVDEFNKLIANQGVRCRVYNALRCPNVLKIDTGEHALNCKLCNDTHFLDVSPTTTFVFFQNQKLNKEYNKEGMWDDQDVASTFKNDVELTIFSKVELLDFSDTFSELVQRQEGQLDRLKYKALSVKYLISKIGTTYSLGQDFEVNSDGAILWIGNQPMEREIYSICYTYPVTYRAIKALHVNRFSQNSSGQIDVTPIQFPQQWVLRRDFLIATTDSNGDLLPKNNNYVVTTP